MEEQKFKVIIVEDVKLELKGTEKEIFRHEIPNAEVIRHGQYRKRKLWPLMERFASRIWFAGFGTGRF